MKYFEPSSNGLSISQKNRIVHSFVTGELVREYRPPKIFFRHVPDYWTRWHDVLDLSFVRFITAPLRRLSDHLENRRGFWGILMRLILKVAALFTGIRDLYRWLFPYAPSIKIVEWCANQGDSIGARQPIFKYVFVSRIWRIPCRGVRTFQLDEPVIFAHRLAETNARIRPNQAAFTFIPENCFSVVVEVAKSMPVVEEARSIIEAFTAKIYQLSLAKILPVICERLENLPPDPPDDDESAIVLLCRTVYRRFGMGQGVTSRQVAEIAEQIRKIKNDPDIDERLKRQLIAKLEQQIHAIP